MVVLRPLVFFEDLVVHDGEKPLEGDNFGKKMCCLQFLSHMSRLDTSTAVGIWSEYCAKAHIVYNESSKEGVWVFERDSRLWSTV